jgi:hypothetical protein
MVDYVDSTSDGEEKPAELDMQEIARLLLQTAHTFKTSYYQGGSYLPYFNEKVATQIKRIVDEILHSGKPMLIPSTDVQPQTLRNKFSQGKDFLLKNMDPEGYYARAFDRITTNLSPKKGLIVRLRPDESLNSALVMEDWRPDFINFISNPQNIGAKFHRLGIYLEDAEIARIKTELEPLKNMFLFEVTKTSILVIRYNVNEDTGNPAVAN